MTHEHGRRRFLPEIQALRALAVLLVVGYHLEPFRVPGGFVGVDVFFVVSGYLITGHMLRELARTGRLSLKEFWARRARRILPAALVLIAAVLPATVLLSPPAQWPQLGLQALASTFYVQNWLLAANSADYSAAAEPATALQHFWSLAVEEQFYVLWPLLVLPAAALARRTGTAPVRRAVPLLAGATAASLAFGIWFTATGNPAAYFITPVRIWELGLGGLLAAAPAAAGRRPFLRSLLAAAGLAAIVAAAFLFSARTPFPGAAALVPVLGTAAVIAAGQTAGPLSVQPLVNLKAVQWTGNISYSLYLWHWPLIVFFKDLTGSGPGPLQSLALLAGSVALAALSFHFVENPVRRSGWLAAAAWRPLAGAAGGTAVVASLCLVPAGLHEQVLAERAGQVRQLLDEPPAKFGAAAMTSRADQTFVGQDRVIVPDPANARADRSPLGDCVAAVEDAATPECSFGHRDGRYTLALVGDSHAAHWFAALEPVAKKQGWRLLTYLHNSCPFSAEKRVLERDGNLACSGPNRRTLERLVSRGDVDAVVTSYYANIHFVDSRTGHRPGAAGFAEHWNALAEAGIEVYPVVDTPRPRAGAVAPDCVARHYDEPQLCDQPRSKGFNGQDLTYEAAALAPEARVVDLSDAFCGRQVCPMVIGNVLLYADKNHVTATYMRTLVPRLEQRLLAAMDGPG